MQPCKKNLAPNGYSLRKTKFFVKKIKTGVIAPEPRTGENSAAANNSKIQENIRFSLSKTSRSTLYSNARKENKNSKFNSPVQFYSVRYDRHTI